MPLNGVVITNGPQPWSIIQQQGGKASIQLSGSWISKTEGDVSVPQVLVRVLSEDSNTIVRPWSKAIMLAAQSWSIELKDIPAGGLYRIETGMQMTASQVRVLRGDMIHHIGIGDLWVIAGQSNAAGYGKGPINDPPEIGIHLFRNNGRWDLASHPFNDSTETTQGDIHDWTNPGHSPYLAFAKLIKREIGWPIGLIPTALGGSPLRKWNPKQNGKLYYNMLKSVRLAGGVVRGVLWYQGCSDCNPDESPTYGTRFGSMVEQWRQDLQLAHLPFLTVQLNRYTIAESSLDNDQSWGQVREQQRIAARTIPNVTVTPSTDCPLSDEIHNSPAGNILLGERLSRAALATVYGKELLYCAPDIGRALFHIAANNTPTIELEFDHVGGYLYATHPEASVFTIEDDLGIVQLLNWSISDRNKITLTLERHLQGQAYVHGGSERNPTSYIPIDSFTYMPLLSFYKYPVSIII